MSPEETTAFIRQWVEDVWNNRRYERVAAAVAPGYVMHNPGAPDVHGPAGFRQFLVMYHSAFGEFHMTVEDVVAGEGKAAWRVSTRATHTGELFGIPPTGRTATVQTLILSHFTNGQWVEDWVQVDMLGMLQQLGAIPAPAGAPA